MVSIPDSDACVSHLHFSDELSARYERMFRHRYLTPFSNEVPHIPYNDVIYLLYSCFLIIRLLQGSPFGGFQRGKPFGLLGQKAMFQNVKEYNRKNKPIKRKQLA
jgi:hypothetical protein